MKYFTSWIYWNLANFPHPSIPLILSGSRMKINLSPLTIRKKLNKTSKFFHTYKIIHPIAKKWEYPTSRYFQTVWRIRNNRMWIRHNRMWIRNNRMWIRNNKMWIRHNRIGSATTECGSATTECGSATTECGSATTDCGSATTESGSVMSP